MAKSKEFKVITWSFNNDHLEWYDVIPYFVREYQSEKPTDRPETFDDFKEFIKRRGMYMFWARCEWETIITGWPAQKRSHKLDVWAQIKQNIDIVTEIVMDAVNKPKPDRK